MFFFFIDYTNELNVNQITAGSRDLSLGGYGLWFYANDRPNHGWESGEEIENTGQ